MTTQEIQDIFQYLDFHKRGSVNHDEFKYRLVDTSYEDIEVSPVLLEQKFKGIMKQFKKDVSQKNLDLGKVYD